MPVKEREQLKVHTKSRNGGILYEYFCDDCSLRFDFWSTLEDRNEPKPCTQCGKLSRRVLSVVNHTWPKDWVQDGLTHDNVRRRGIDEYVL